MKKSNTIKFLLKCCLFLKVLFIKSRKQFCRFLIPISFLLNPLFLFMFTEKVNAQTIKLTCNGKSHFKPMESENWANKNRNFDLEINQTQGTITKWQKFFYKGKNYDLDFYYSIKDQKDNQIVAILDRVTSIEDGPQTGALTLDLNSRKFSEVSTINDKRGISFSNYYATCDYTY